MASEERQELRGTTLDARYTLGGVIGIGGTGVCFEATRLSDGHPVVVKTLRPIFADHPDLARRLRREGEVSRRVAHPSIVPVIDEGILYDGSPYTVMERIDGEPLHRILRRMGPLEVPVVAAIVLRVADVLHRAHAAGYVHRDVKPEHIILDRTSKGELRMWLLDFGVCAAETAPADEVERERGRVYGTPSYVSPEQASGNPAVDARADIFGLGVVVFEALAGRLPYSGSTVTNLLRAIIREDAPRVGLLVDGVSQELDAIVAQMLSRKRENRLTNMRALARAWLPYARDRRAIERNIAASLDLKTASTGYRSVVSEHVTTVERTAA
ncbi:MAG: serine/threonine protein kinase [Deltaproteobacteria bacterium]|nr:serine/threonine protein kinase [Deltaproteobacteria bacterium]